MTKPNHAHEQAEDLFQRTAELADSETDPGSDLLERWLRPAEAALKTKTEKDQGLAR